MSGTILVTGGAGYTGSQVVRQLGDRALVHHILAQYGVDTVMHVAARTVVPESVRNPLKYYRNNTANSRTLLECFLETASTCVELREALRLVTGGSVGEQFLACLLRRKCECKRTSARVATTGKRPSSRAEANR